METVDWQRVRVVRLSGEFAQRELEYYRAKRANIL